MALPTFKGFDSLQFIKAGLAGREVADAEDARFNQLQVGRAAAGGDLVGAANTAFNLGELNTGGALLKIAQNAESAKRANLPKPPAGTTFVDPNNPAAGVQPIPGFVDFKSKIAAAGRPQVSVNVAGAKGETAFQKELGKSLAGKFEKLSESGVEAEDDIAVLKTLEGVLPESGGIGTAIRGALAERGILVGEGADDLQTFQSFIDRLTPRQRVPGSGATSDFEAKLFKSSLPSLMRSPAANRMILSTMQALAVAKRRRGEIATLVMTGNMTRDQAVQELRKVGDPWAEFRKWRKTPEGRAATKGHGKANRSGGSDGFKILKVE